MRKKQKVGTSNWTAYLNFKFCPLTKQKRAWLVLYFTSRNSYFTSWNVHSKAWNERFATWNEKVSSSIYILCSVIASLSTCFRWISCCIRTGSGSINQINVLFGQSFLDGFETLRQKEKRIIRKRWWNHAKDYYICSRYHETIHETL